MSAAARSRVAVLILFGALVTGLGAWHWTRFRGAALAAAMLLTVLPPLLPLAGLWRRRRYTYRWAALTLAPAMAWSLTELVAVPGARLPAAVIGLIAFLALAALVAALRTMPAAAGDDGLRSVPGPRGRGAR